MKYTIEYLNAKNGFKKTAKTFNTFDGAVKWGRKNIGNFNIDMIKINH